MDTVVNTIQINGPVEPVFDLVTTTRYWPQWHPATVGVGGVTERPVALGDVIQEQAQIGARLYEGAWTVVEHERPVRVRLRGESDRIYITYTFQAQGEGSTVTEFRRQLEYHPEDFSASVPNPAALAQLMYQQSEQALQRLKQLVEALLNGKQ